MAHFSCQFSEWSIFQYEMQQQGIDFQEQYTADGVVVELQLQVHQIPELADKIRDVTRGREQLKLVEEQHD